MVEGNLVDVVNGTIYPARLNLHRGELVHIERLRSARDDYILPGLIDSHLHIESSLLCPSRFAEAALPHGTTAVVADPHEIANVLGMEGIRYMVRDGKDTPLRFYFTAPSCVPATRWETSGAVIGWREVEELILEQGFIALGEVMDYRGVIEENPEVMGKIEVAKRNGVPIDGHCPGLGGADLDMYIFAGITTDHECVTLEEAEEKHRKGMTIMVREGSASRNMRELLPFARDHECFLVTDDMHAADLMQGHMDARLRMAVEGGMDPIDAVRAATLWPSRHYDLPIGAVEVGRPADFLVVSDLTEFRVKEVYRDGRLVAKNGRPLFRAVPLRIETRIHQQETSADDFVLRHPGPVATVRVIEVRGQTIESEARLLDVEVSDGRITVDPERDIALIAVVNRYQRKPPALGLVRGFGLTRGAMASTVSHDSHNIVAVGMDPHLMAIAVNRVSRSGGYFVTDGTRETSLELDVAGLMSTAHHREVADKERQLHELLSQMGCRLSAPFMTLSFQTLLVVPELKMSDRGLFDSVNMRFVDVVV